MCIGYMRNKSNSEKTCSLTFPYIFNTGDEIHPEFEKV